MAVTVFCDWCGELMELDDHDDPLGLIASGRGQDGNFFFEKIGLHYHARHGDEDCCLEQVRQLLEERAGWAHDQDQESREWRLVPRVKRTRPEDGCPRDDEFRRRAEAGTALYKLGGLQYQVQDALRKANVVTLEELAGRSAKEAEAIYGVGPRSMRRLEELLTSRGMAWAEARESAEQKVAA